MEKIDINSSVVKKEQVVQKEEKKKRTTGGNYILPAKTQKTRIMAHIWFGLLSHGIYTTAESGVYIDTALAVSTGTSRSSWRESHFARTRATRASRESLVVLISNMMQFECTLLTT